MIILFRHGECEHNILNRFSCGLNSKSSLTDNGIDMVQKSAKEILDNFINKDDKIKIYSSPLLRAEQTSIVISEVLEYYGNIVYDDRLKEVDMGKYDERSVEEFKYNIYDLSHCLDYGGESIDDVNNRLISFINENLANKDENINIVVSHALPLRQMNKILTGSDEKIKVAKYIIIK